MNVLKNIYILLFLLFVNKLHAAEQIQNEQIGHINTYKTLAVIRLTGTSDNLDGCTRQNAGKYVAIVYLEGKEMYSASLSAYMANRKVGFGVSGCQSWGSTTIPKAYRVDVYKN